MNIPSHVAFIPDGNRRWARERLLPTSAGHASGGRRIVETILCANSLGIKCVSYYVFSHENVSKRSDQEKFLLGEIIRSLIKNEFKQLVDINARILILGEQLDFIDSDLLEMLDDIVRQTQHNSGITVCLYLGYSARYEILNAAKRCAELVRLNKMDIDEISEPVFSRFMYSYGIPDPDLLIRTSGEQRVSNFLLWQLAYTEMFFAKNYWPDFSKVDLEAIIHDYSSRERRYGA